MIYTTTFKHTIFWFFQVIEHLYDVCHKFSLRWPFSNGFACYKWTSVIPKWVIRWKESSMTIKERGFPDLGIKTSSYGLMTWASKSPWRFIGLGLKTKQASVCQLRLKTDERAMLWDMHRDLAACFAWKQVGLGFPSLVSRLAEAWWRVVHMAPPQMLRWSQVEDGRVDGMGCVRPCNPCFAVFVLLGPRGIVVF
jgi:hypothetical protein